MPSYQYSTNILDKDNLEILIDRGVVSPLTPIKWSTTLVDKVYLDVLVSAEFSKLEAIRTSKTIIDETNIEVLVAGPDLFVYPPGNNIRQIYSDEDKVYAATDSGLVVFSL